MQISLLSIIIALAAFFGLLLFSLLMFREGNRSHSSRILAWYILCFTLFALHNLLLAEGGLKYVPFLYRATKPLMYAAAPLAFLYVRASLYREIGFRKRDWMYFLPAILHALELLPFYLMPQAEKKAMVYAFYSDMNGALKHSEGMMPSYFHPALIFLYSAWVLFLAAKMMAEAGQKKERFKDLQNRQLYTWLRFFLWGNIIYLVLLIAHYVVYPFMPFNTYQLNTIETALILFCIGVVLFFQPNILYGFRGEAVVTDPESAKTNHAKHHIMPDSKRKVYLEALERHFKERQPYLQAGYTIKQLSEEITVPYSYLSTLINQEYGMNFNEFVNGYRVAYVKLLMHEPDAQNYTLEALAEKSGFSSRATFARAFNRVEGCTPSEYFRKMWGPAEGFVSNS